MSFCLSDVSHIINVAINLVDKFGFFSLVNFIFIFLLEIGKGLRYFTSCSGVFRRCRRTTCLCNRSVVGHKHSFCPQVLRYFVSLWNGIGRCCWRGTRTKRRNLQSWWFTITLITKFSLNICPSILIFFPHHRKLRPFGWSIGRDGSKS